MPQGLQNGFLIFTLRIEEAISLLILSVIILSLVALYFWDTRQKHHTILRNYPIIGHLRYFFEFLGEYLRAYWFTSDREELPFNRAERSWVYRASKNVNSMVGFGSTRDLKPVGTIFFVDAPFPVLGRDVCATRQVTIGEKSRHPYTTNSLFNISAMSFGALSAAAVKSLSQGAKIAGCWMNTGEGGVSKYHLDGGGDLIAQIGTAKFGFCNEKGELNDEKLKEIAAYPQVKMFEVKLSQGAKPGKGGILPAVKVTREIAEIRGVTPHKDAISPNRHPDIGSVSELLDFIEHVRKISGKPTGFKTVLGSYEWLDELFIEIHKRGIEKAPDFITLDGSEGGTGASPLSLIDYMGLPINESLPVLVDTLIEYGLKDRIKVIAAGKLITPAEVAWALCVGADFINSARGFLLSLGCIQALRCHLNTCPTGITTHNQRLQKGIDVKTKAVRVGHYAKNMDHEVGIISHSCGVREPRELGRSHARIVEIARYVTSFAV